MVPSSGRKAGAKDCAVAKVLSVAPPCDSVSMAALSSTPSVYAPVPAAPPTVKVYVPAVTTGTVWRNTCWPAAGAVAGPTLSPPGPVMVKVG